MSKIRDEELENVLIKWQEKRNLNNAKKEQGSKEMNEIRKKFQNIKDNIIKPIMEEYGKKLKEFNHNYEILDNDSIISFNFIPSGSYHHGPREKGLSFRLSARPIIYASIRSRSTYDEKIKPEQITDDYIQEKIIEVIKSALK